MLTSKQAAILAQAAGLGSIGVLVGFDDQAGRKAAVRVYRILRTVSGRLQSDVLCGICRTTADVRPWHLDSFDVSGLERARSRTGLGFPWRR
jgi:hypothetical protein